jgi:hypothetical protein
MKSLHLLVPLLLSIAWAAMAQEPPPEPQFHLDGILSLRGVAAGGGVSWLRGGFDPLESSGPESHNDFVPRESLQIGGDWRQSTHFDAHVHGVARDDGPGTLGSHFGITEAYFDIRPLKGKKNSLQLRTGMFFLPTSRENVGPLWSSPYTITYSALNTWIAQEVRPVGLDLSYRYAADSGRSMTVAGTAFRRNDTMGTLLAWRGWSLGDHLAVYREVLPLPPSSLRDSFPEQRADGTRPIQHDLDENFGWSLRGRWQLRDQAVMQFVRIDNRGTGEFYPDPSPTSGQWAWRTRFYIVGGEWTPDPLTTVAVEYSWGTTSLYNEEPGAPFLNMGYYAGYVLASRRIGRNRVSARIDQFGTDDRANSRIVTTSNEHGVGLTLSYFRIVSSTIRVGLELVNVHGTRKVEPAVGPTVTGHNLILEVRKTF